jgi:hypothetical protein
VPCQVARKGCSWSGNKNDSDAAPDPTIKRRRADPASPKPSGSKKRPRTGTMTDVSGTSTKNDDEEEEEDDIVELVPRPLMEVAANNRDGIGMLVEIGTDLKELWKSQEGHRMEEHHATSAAIREMALAVKVLAESQRALVLALNTHTNAEFVEGSSHDGEQMKAKAAAAAAAEKRQQLAKKQADDAERAEMAKEIAEVQGKGKEKETHEDELAVGAEEVQEGQEEEEEEGEGEGDVQMDAGASD